MSYIQPHPDFYHSELNLDFSAHSAREGGGGGGGGVEGSFEAVDRQSRNLCKKHKLFFPRKIEMKLLDICLYLFIHFPTHPHIQAILVVTRSHLIPAWRGKKKEIKIHQLMCRLVMK